MFVVVVRVIIVLFVIKQGYSITCYSDTNFNCTIDEGEECFTMLTVHNDTLRLRYGCLTNSLFNAAAVCNIKHDANDEVQMKCCSNEDLCNKYITVSDFNITTVIPSPTTLSTDDNSTNIWIILIWTIIPATCIINSILCVLLICQVGSYYRQKLSTRAVNDQLSDNNNEYTSISNNNEYTSISNISDNNNEYTSITYI